jgi:hypothetical protein
LRGVRKALHTALSGSNSVLTQLVCCGTSAKNVFSCGLTLLLHTLPIFREALKRVQANLLGLAA